MSELIWGKILVSCSEVHHLYFLFVSYHSGMFFIIFSDKVKDTACCATKPSIFSAAYFPTSLYWKKTSQVFSSNQSLGWLVDQSFDWLVSQSINQSIDAIDSVDKFTLHTLISVCIFSILFSIHFLRCWLGEFCLMTKSSFSWWSFLYSQDLIVWFRVDR